MKQKRLMLLGGIRYLLPVIKSAHEEGYYVITADYIPNNIAHKFSDEYVNVSIIDREAVLRVAKEREIDGIMSFGVDPGVVTASYVQEQLGLPSFGPYQSIEILQNKDKFRSFLTSNGFNVPRARSFSSINEALADIKWYHYPVIVKPTDSAGSKGVARVDKEDGLRQALENAFKQSIRGRVIVEEFIEKTGCSSDTDCFCYNGHLQMVNYSAQRFDPEADNPYTPSAYTWPSTFSHAEEQYLTNEIQRLLSLLEMNTCICNIETRVGINGKPYIMEVSPRGGGNRLAEVIRYACGVDMIKASTRAAVGDPIDEICQKPFKGHWAEVVIHANKDGRFVSMEIDQSLPAEIIENDLWVKSGDKVKAFTGANNAIGILILKFKNKADMLSSIASQKQWLRINIA